MIFLLVFEPINPLIIVAFKIMLMIVVVTPVITLGQTKNLTPLER